MANPPEDPDRPLSVWQVIGSTLAAAMGVQSQRNRERDFTRGKPLQFIVAGVLFGVIFVVALMLLVNTILGSAG